MFAIVKVGQQNNKELSIRSEVNLSQWHPDMSVEQTITHLAIYERASFQSLIKVCESLFQIRRYWKDRKEFVPDKGITKGRKKTDWQVFLETLNKNNKIKPQKINNLISIYESYINEKGTIKYLYNEVGFLPANFTAMYEIAAIKIEDKNGKKALEEIIKGLNENRDLGVSEIRSIKKKNISTNSKILIEEATFKLPSNQETLTKLSPIWNEIEDYTKKINDLIQSVGVKDLKLTVENPKDKIKLIELREKTIAKRKILRNVKLIIKKTEKVKNITELEEMPFEEKTYKTAKEDILKNVFDKSLKEFANAEFKKGQEERRKKNLEAEKKKKEMEKYIKTLSESNLS